MQSFGKSYLLVAVLMGLGSSASADIINVQIGAAATEMGPNLTKFDNLSSPGSNLSANLVPGVPQNLTFYALSFSPTCDAAVCNGIFARGLNFGFVNAQDLTNPGSGSSTYIQPVKDLIANANTASSSHTLSISTGGGFVIDLSDSEHLTVSVPAQTFSAVATSETAQIDSVSASFLLTAAPVPELSSSRIVLAALLILALSAKARQVFSPKN